MQIDEILISIIFRKQQQFRIKIQDYTARSV